MMLFLKKRRVRHFNRRNLLDDVTSTEWDICSIFRSVKHTFAFVFQKRTPRDIDTPRPRDNPRDIPRDAPRDALRDISRDSVETSVGFRARFNVGPLIRLNKKPAVSSLKSARSEFKFKHIDIRGLYNKFRYICLVFCLKLCNKSFG